MRLLVAELADAMKLQIEGRRIDPRESIVQGAGVATVHLADEAQGQMQLFARLPAGAGHSALQQHELLGDGIRDGKGHE
jgi:hypothetical protein